MSAAESVVIEAAIHRNAGHSHRVNTTYVTDAALSRREADREV